MVRRPLFSRAAAGVAATLLLATLAAPSAAIASTEPDDPPSDTATTEDGAGVVDDADPLLITIDGLTPGTLPERGPVEVSGTVTNNDVVPWEKINLYPFVGDDTCTGCPDPITSRTGLTEATETDAAQLVGERITSVQDTVDVLEPGASATYSLTVPRSAIDVSAPGVYWFGVHALGISEETPQDLFADGRARTFLPYLPASTRGAVEAAMVLPLRRRIAYTGAGAISRPDVWESALSATGSLGRPLAFAGASAGRPVSWLVDPAVLDAVRRLANGNPARSLDPSVPPDDDEEPTDDPSVSGSPTGEAGAEEGGDGKRWQHASPETRAAASEWLEDLEDEVRGEELLTLPYGDPDLAAAAEYDPMLYLRARRQPSAVLNQWGLAGTPAIGSPSGFLDEPGLEAVADDSMVLMTDRMFGAEEYPDGPPGVARVGDHPVAITSYGATEGGPGPDPRLSAVALRQRVLSEAAVRMIETGRRAPLVVVIPQQVDPEEAAEFWSGLGVPWLDLTTLADITDRNGKNLRPGDLTYPAAQEEYELDGSLFNELDALVTAGATLQNLLTENTTVADQVTQEALSGVSYSVRADPSAGTSSLARSRDWIQRRQRAIRISAPRGVTLSSASGGFSVTITNRLEQPVTVRIQADTDAGTTIEAGEPVRLAPESRTTIPLDLHTSRPGVHNVRLSLTDTDGTALGATVQLPVRSTQVGSVIWVIIGTGVGILFLAIAIRLYRRIREHRRGDAGNGDGALTPVEEPVPDPAGTAT